MPRKKRQWYEGANLHVIARGNHRSDIFKDKTDYELYLNYFAMFKNNVENIEF